MTTTKHTISLFIQGDSWMSKHSNPDIIALFGTDIIETAFTARASSLEVLREIRALNPECVVSIS